MSSIVTRLSSIELNRAQNEVKSRIQKPKMALMGHVLNLDFQNPESSSARSCSRLKSRIRNPEFQRRPVSTGLEHTTSRIQNPESRGRLSADFRWLALSKIAKSGSTVQILESRIQNPTQAMSKAVIQNPESRIQVPLPRRLAAKKVNPESRIRSPETLMDFWGETSTPSKIQNPESRAQFFSSKNN